MFAACEAFLKDLQTSCETAPTIMVFITVFHYIYIQAQPSCPLFATSHGLLGVYTDGLHSVLDRNPVGSALTLLFKMHM